MAVDSRSSVCLGEPGLQRGLIGLERSCLVQDDDDSADRSNPAENLPPAGVDAASGCDARRQMASGPKMIPANRKHPMIEKTTARFFAAVAFLSGR